MSKEQAFPNDIHISACLDLKSTRPVDKPNFPKQTFSQAMKGHLNLLNKQLTSGNATDKPFPVACQYRSNSIGNRKTSSRRSPKTNTNYYQNNNSIIKNTNICRQRNDRVHHTTEKKVTKTTNVLLHIAITIKFPELNQQVIAET